jgi:hypothetical protein
MRQARATVARAKEQKRLKAVAALAASKAIAAVRKAIGSRTRSTAATLSERAGSHAEKRS